MLCKNCETHDAVKWSKYASGNFCSRRCAQSFNAKKNTPWNKGKTQSQEHKDKVASGLRKFFEANGGAVSKGQKHAEAVGAATKGKYGVANNIFEMSSRTRSKLIQRLELKCCVCGWDEEVVDIHHIVPRKRKGSNDHSNLTPLCPNHHRLAERHKLPQEKMKTLEDLVGDRWKELYYG